MGSLKPADNKMCLLERSGKLSGTRGTIALNNIAPLRTSGCRRMVLAAILAPFENPIAIVLCKSNQIYNVRNTFGQNQPIR